MMLPFALYPTKSGSIFEARYAEMRKFCFDTFGIDGILGPHCWTSSHLSRSFAFKSESDRIVFRMAFPEG